MHAVARFSAFFVLTNRPSHVACMPNKCVREREREREQARKTNLWCAMNNLWPVKEFPFIHTDTHTHTTFIHSAVYVCVCVRDRVLNLRVRCTHAAQDALTALATTALVLVLAL